MLCNGFLIVRLFHTVHSTMDFIDSSLVVALFLRLTFLGILLNFYTEVFLLLHIGVVE